MSSNAAPSELDAFREQWLAEVRQRTQATQLAPVAEAGSSSSASAEPVPALGPRLQGALDYYRLAVDYEQRGELDHALALYRKAFRLDAHVDKLYHKELQRSERVQSSVAATTGPEEPAVVYAAPISAIVAQLHACPPHELVFKPEDESRRGGVPIARMPDELLVQVLVLLATNGDVRAVERMSLVNRKLRLLTLDVTIWRTLVQLVYVPPQVADQHASLELMKRYKLDFRRMWIECPRVRLDGVYISVCHYMRNGVSENPWHHPQHLITYHRYLRFFPDGTMLMLLSNGDSPPREIVYTLKPTLRIEGLMLGKWSLNGHVVNVQDLTPVVGRQTKYSFIMTLVLKSRPIGRWAKLDFVEYSSVSIENGDIDPLPMRHERPFHFSKVRSYGLGLQMPKDEDEDGLAQVVGGLATVKLKE
ncbi:hypothetical protein AURDEDRAFT_113215 [Auricularia subglabra TFB-10046 SS5]|nr:hypothetical protein AURDEDRAFT_113215 [Auricularia subglabra TFB-10046 SS5]